MSDQLYGYGILNNKKKKPKARLTVSINEMKKSRHGKLDASLDKEFNTKTPKILFTNKTGEWRKYT